MPLYSFHCASCGREDAVFRAVDDRKRPEPCPCGSEMTQQFTTEVALYVPPYHRAPGSSGSSADSCDRQARYLQSEQHRKDKQEAERAQDRLRRSMQAEKVLEQRLAALGQEPST